jgi:hypothetical protein
MASWLDKLTLMKKQVFPKSKFPDILQIEAITTNNNEGSLEKALEKLLDIGEHLIERIVRDWWISKGFLIYFKNVISQEELILMSKYII